jgi:preflagellin peptidase FlaK
VFATIPDLLRLVAVPFFGYVAYRDVETRRIPNETWYPLAALAVVLLVWDAYRLFVGDPTVVAFQRRRFLVAVAVSIFFIVPLVYGFWLIGGFGGADVKAFWVIAILFPVFPAYNLWELGVGLNFQLPYVRPALPVFSLTILSNTVVAGIVYPVALAARNAAAGYVSPGMFIAKPVPVDEIPEEYGTILEFSDRSLTDDLSPAGLHEYFSWRGLDLDALRMYLQWRGLTLAEVRDQPDRYRDPESLPAAPNDPGDGAITDGGTAVDADAGRDGAEPDPWGAEAFLDDIDGSAYGTTPEALRDGLDALVSDDVVWISPGIPFLVPLFAGLGTALVAGDLLFAVMDVVGLV